MSRLLFLGDSAATGFGTVTWDLGTRLLALGEDVRFISTNQTAEPIPHPLGERTWDAERGINPVEVILSGFRDEWKPDAAIILGDFEAVRVYVQRTGRGFKQAAESIPIFHYCPVEGVDLPPAWNQLWSLLHPVAMTEFGADQIETVTGTRPPVIFHGVDTDDFHPVTATNPGLWLGKAVTSRDGAKRALQYPTDRIMVLRTDRHMPRKQYNRLIRAMVPVFDAVPELDLVIHCRTHDQGGRLEDSIWKLPPEFRTRVRLTRAHDSWSGLSRPALNVLVNAADIYATNSAEGFGLTPAEASAAGVPVVAMDYSTLPEILGAERREVHAGPNGENLDPEPYREAAGGLLVRWHNLVDNEYDHYWASVDVEAFAQAVMRLARKPALRREMGRRGTHHVTEHFTWDRAARAFSDLVSATEQRAAA